MTIQPNFKLEKWLKEMKRLETDIVYLRFNNTDFLNLAKRFNNHKLEPYLWEFTKRNYVSYMSMSIRRISGKYRDGISLYKLLEDILNNSEAITSRWFLEQWPGGKHETLFIEFFGSEKSLLKSTVTNHLNKLVETTKSVIERADQFEAHIDINPKLDNTPTFNDIDNSVNVIAEIYQKYYYLFKQASLSI